MTARVVPTEMYHVRELCEGLRARERAAFEKLGEIPEKAITKELAKSILTFTGLIDDKVVLVFGAQTTTMLSDAAYVWIVCGEHIEYFPMTFLRHSKETLDLLSHNFKQIYGYVVHDFDKSIRWLEWLGFQIKPASGGLNYFYKEL